MQFDDETALAAPKQFTKINQTKSNWISCFILRRCHRNSVENDTVILFLELLVDLEELVKNDVSIDDDEFRFEFQTDFRLVDVSSGRRFGSFGKAFDCCTLLTQRCQLCFIHRCLFVAIVRDRNSDFSQRESFSQQ